MDLLNQKLDRVVEADKIKPAAKLREMQNNEKLVAVNERVEEVMKYNEGATRTQSFHFVCLFKV